MRKPRQATRHPILLLVRRDDAGGGLVQQLADPQAVGLHLGDQVVERLDIATTSGL